MPAEKPAEWAAIEGHLISKHEACPKCGLTDRLEVRDHSLMWHDGEVWCGRCERFVRLYDAG